MEQTGRCVNCRTDIKVPATYADGDHIKCGACDTQHRVVRLNNSLRLVLADVAPLRDALRDHQTRIERLENELRAARGSLGIGTMGFGVGVLYVLDKIALDELPLTRDIIVIGLVLAVVTGVLLEVVNFLFLSKRRLIDQLSEQLALLREECKELQRKIRESGLRR